MGKNGVCKSIFERPFHVWCGRSTVMWGISGGEDKENCGSIVWTMYVKLRSQGSVCHWSTLSKIFKKDSDMIKCGFKKMILEKNGEKQIEIREAGESGSVQDYCNDPEQRQ